MFRGAALTVAALVVTAGVAAGSVAPDGDGDPAEGVQLRPGTYSGFLDLSFAGLTASNADGTISVTGSYDGFWDLEVVAPVGVATGSFTLVGSLVGEVTAAGVTGTLETSSVGGGELLGDDREVEATGVETTTGAATVPLGTFPISNTTPFPEVTLTFTEASCTEVEGTWERELELVAAGVGYSNPEVIEGSLVGVRTTAAEDRERVVEFFERFEGGASAEELAGLDLDGLPQLLVDYRDFLVRAETSGLTASDGPEPFFALLAEGEALSARARNLDPCDLELLGDGVRHVYSLPYRMVRGALESLFGAVGGSTDWWDSGSMRQLALKALRHGVIGPLAVNPGVEGFASDVFTAWMTDVIAAEVVRVDGAWSYPIPGPMSDVLLVGAALDLPLVLPDGSEIFAGSNLLDAADRILSAPSGEGGDGE